MKDHAFQIKAFYHQGQHDGDESMYSSFNLNALSSKSQATLVHSQSELFGFKFGLEGNEKSFKMIVCSENQQQVRMVFRLRLRHCTRMALRHTVLVQGMVRISGCTCG